MVTKDLPSDVDTDDEATDTGTDTDTDTDTDTGTDSAEETKQRHIQSFVGSDSVSRDADIQQGAVSTDAQQAIEQAASEAGVEVSEDDNETTTTEDDPNDLTSGLEESGQSDLGTAENLDIEEGDTVIVSDANFAQIHGEVEAEVVWAGDEYIDATLEDGREVEVDIGDIERVVVDDGPSAGVVAEMDVEEKLDRAFEIATDRSEARKMGVEQGSTTAHKMEILTLPDGSQVFATPMDAYVGGTLAVSSAGEARKNNLNSPKVIQHLGGGSCETAIVESPNGEEYVLREGIEGPTLGEYEGDLTEEDIKESIARTYAAGYYVGNGDLHKWNVVIDEEEREAKIVDHDHAGAEATPHNDGWMDPFDVTANTPIPGSVDQATVEEIYDIAIAYETGELDIPADISRTHKDYFIRGVENAIESAQQAKYDGLPPELEPEPPSPPDGYEEVTDFEPGQRVIVSNEWVDGVEAEVVEIYEDEELIVWDDDDYEMVLDDPAMVDEVLTE